MIVSILQLFQLKCSKFHLQATLFEFNEVYQIKLTKVSTQSLHCHSVGRFGVILVMAGYNRSMNFFCFVNLFFIIIIIIFFSIYTSAEYL